jgi:hypothetical protein
MNTIILKLVGSSTKDYIITTTDTYFTRKEIVNNLHEKGINLVYFINIKFILNGEYINDQVKHHFDSTNKKQVYVFTQDNLIKKELIEHCFELIEPDKPSLPSYDSLFGAAASDESLESSDDEISDEEIKRINNIIIKQFEDPDFVTLLRICNTKPQLLGLVNNYMMSGTVVEPIEPISSIDASEFKYNEELEMLEKLGYTGNIVKSVIIHFNGHLNLCIRYLNHHAFAKN